MIVKRLQSFTYHQTFRFVANVANFRMIQRMQAV